MDDIPNEQGQWKVRIFALISIFETALFCGIPYGWGILLYLLKDEGIYSDLCLPSGNTTLLNNETTGNEVSANMSDLEFSHTCTEQDERFNLWFGISTLIGFTSNVIIGKMIQVIGAVKTRIFYMPIFIIGSLCIAFTSKGLPWLILPGLSMLFVGGFSIMISNIRVSSFLTVGSSVYIGVMFGSYDMSSVMTRVIKALYDIGVNRNYSFTGLAILHIIISGINTVVHSCYNLTVPNSDEEMPGIDNSVCVLDDENISNNTKNTKVGGGGQNGEKVTVLRMENNDYVTEQTTKDKASHLSKETKAGGIRLSVRKHLTFNILGIHTLFVSILALNLVFFFGSINKQLEIALNNKQDVGYFSDVLSYTLIGGIIGSFISGSLLEWQKNVFSNSKKENYRRLMPQVLPLSICSVLVILLSVLTFMHSSMVFYGLFVIVVLLRSFTYFVHAGFCANVFPVDQVSFLYGFVITVCGFLSLLQYALFVWMNSYDDALSQVNWLLLGLSILTIIHPMNVYRLAKKQSN